MEWDLKMPPWDFPELDQNACESNLSSVVGSSGALDCSVDLKLGDLGNLGLATTWREQSGASVVSVPPRLPAPTTAKRQRLLGGGGQNVSCLVDGCKNDLSNCREYHRRHKVCQEHSKTPIVLVGGQEQRFCQQCSRFHMLVEFDDVKRSCRKRLDGHNRRRRKPQMELTTSVNLLNHHGTSFTSNPQTDLSWSTIGKSDEGPADTTHLPAVPFVDDVLQHPLQPFGSNLWRSFGEGKQLPFLPSNGTTESSGSKIVFSDGASPVLNSGSALSLLSSSAQKPAIGVGNLVSVDSISMSQPLLSSLQFGDMSIMGMEDEDVGTVLVSDGNGAELHCYSMFHSGSEGLSDGSSQPSLPFKWQ